MPEMTYLCNLGCNIINIVFVCNAFKFLYWTEIRMQWEGQVTISNCLSSKLMVHDVNNQLKQRNKINDYFCAFVVASSS